MRPISSSLILAAGCAAALIASTSGGSALSFAVGSRGGVRSGFAPAGPPPIGGQQSGLDLTGRSGRFGENRRDGFDRGGRDRSGEGGCGFGGGRGRGGERSSGFGQGSFGYGGCGDLGGFFGGYGGYGYSGGYGDAPGRAPSLPSASGIRPSPVLPPAIYVIEPTGRRGARAPSAPSTTGSAVPGSRVNVLASGATVTQINP